VVAVRNVLRGDGSDLAFGALAESVGGCGLGVGLDGLGGGAVCCYGFSGDACLLGVALLDFLG
jgi:hypothetical protein